MADECRVNARVPTRMRVRAIASMASMRTMPGNNLIRNLLVTTICLFYVSLASLSPSLSLFLSCVSRRLPQTFRHNHNADIFMSSAAGLARIAFLNLTAL